MRFSRAWLALMCHISVLFSCALAPLSFGRDIIQADHDAILKSLGYIPANLLGVAARSPVDARPIVLKTYPLGGGALRRRAKAMEGGTPFPTLYWLSCSKLQKAISDLERRGFVNELEDRVNRDLALIGRMKHCHESYACERWGTLIEHDQEKLLSEDRSLRIVESLRETGVAGSYFRRCEKREEVEVAAVLPSVKCLHAHYAHYRSGGLGANSNIIGKMTHELLEDEYAWCL